MSDPGIRTTAATRTQPGATGKSQLAYRWIRERIADGRYTAGYRLVLDQIARELGVSAVPVREAVRMLEAEGLVTFERNVGAQVAMLDATEYVVTMQTLALVEGYATALSAPTLPAGSVKRARAINEQLAATLEHFDPASFTKLNLDFHSALFESCPNAHILDLVHRGWGRLAVLRESTFSFVPGRARESVVEHSTILDLIESGADAIVLELAARNHRLATLDAFIAQRRLTEEVTP